MRIILLLLALAPLARAADTLTIDATNVVVVNGAAPGTTAAGEVRIGGGQVRTGGQVVVQNSSATALQVAGTAVVGNATIGRTAQAGAAEAVRGDDPRLANARTASGGNADTVGGKAATTFVAASTVGAANGVAKLDAGGKVPLAMLPPLASARGMQVFTQNGTFTVPSGVTQIQVMLLGGGGGSDYRFDVDPVTFNAVIVYDGGDAGGFAWVTLTSLKPSYAVVIGAAGKTSVTTAGDDGTAGGTSSFGTDVVCKGGNHGNDAAAPADGGSATSTGQGMLLRGQLAAGPSVGGSGCMLGGNFGSGYGPRDAQPGVCIVTW